MNSGDSRFKLGNDFRYGDNEVVFQQPLLLDQDADHYRPQINVPHVAPAGVRGRRLGDADEGTLEFYVGITFSVVFIHAGYGLLVEGDRVHLRYVSEVHPESPDGLQNRWVTMRNPDGTLAFAATAASQLHPTGTSDGWYDPVVVSIGGEDCPGRERECYVEYRKPLVFTCTDTPCGTHEIWDCDSGGFSSIHDYWIDVGHAEDRREITCPEYRTTWYSFVIASE